MTNASDPTSKEGKQNFKEIVAPRLRELLDEPEQPTAELREVQQEVTITKLEVPRKPSRRIEGPIAAAILAPVIGLLTMALLHLFVPAIEGLGLRSLFFENGLSNLTVVLTLGAWLLSWVALYEAWHDRTVSRAKLYSVSIIGLLISAACFIPAIYRLFE